MYLNQIEAFVNIAKYKSFSKAANQLYLSQPTISAYIKALEADVGTQLITRTTKDVELTEAGMTFYKYALELLDLREKACKEMRSYSDGISGTISIATSPFASQYILPNMIAEAVNAYPKLHFHVIQSANSEIEKAVETHKADFGIGEMTVTQSTCLCQTLSKEKLVLITPNTPKYQALNGAFPMEMFSEVPFILQNKGSIIRHTILNFFSAQNIRLEDMNIVADMQTMFGICQAVRENLGISIVIQKTAADYVRFGYCLEFDLHNDILTLPVNTICQPFKKLTPAADYFYKFLFNKN